ncbi:hypothetical protein ACGFNX_32275 [Streptomyces sp. NPDC048723]
MTTGLRDICVFHELAPRTYGWSGHGASQAITMEPPPSRRPPPSSYGPS